MAPWAVRISRIAPGAARLLAYDRAWLRPDLVAGLSVAAVALPVGIAYADLARVPAVVGIYSAILPLLAYAIFGSSRQLIIGPDASTCFMVASSLTAIAAPGDERYLSLLVALTLMTGVMYVLAGVARFGFIANFLSKPILVGYLNGVALVILLSQLPKLCGYTSAAAGCFGMFREFVLHIRAVHPPTLALAIAAIVVLAGLRRWAPRVPGALVVTALGIAAVEWLDLGPRGARLLGPVPAGLPTLRWPDLDPSNLTLLLRDAAGITLVSFTSGVLTAKSFAGRGRYTIDANQELIAFGASNLASGLAQGFPVTGADSRTAVNYAMGGRTQLVGVVAAITMLLFLLFLTAPLASLPIAVLGGVIAVSAMNLFDLSSLRDLAVASQRELALSLTTTIGVLTFGVLPGVLLAVALTLIWLLAVAARPSDATLGRVPGDRGYHSTTDYPEAETVPGLLLFRFDASLVFFNMERFRERVLQVIERSQTPVEWIVVDASPVSVIDYTALRVLDELRAELAARGIRLHFAHARRTLTRFFRGDWLARRTRDMETVVFPSLATAVQAFANRGQAGGGINAG